MSGVLVFDADAERVLQGDLLLIDRPRPPAAVQSAETGQDVVLVTTSGPPGPRGETGPQGLQGPPGISSGEHAEQLVEAHVLSPTPHPAYDDAPSLVLLFENALI